MELCRLLPFKTGSFYLSKGGCLKHFLSERYGERIEFLAHDRPTEYHDAQFKSSKPGAEHEQA